MAADPIYIAARNKLISEAAMYAYTQADIEVAARPPGMKILEGDEYNHVWNRYYHQRMDALWRERGALLYRRTKEGREDRGLLDED